MYNAFDGACQLDIIRTTELKRNYICSQESKYETNPLFRRNQDRESMAQAEIKAIRSRGKDSSVITCHPNKATGIVVLHKRVPINNDPHLRNTRKFKKSVKMISSFIFIFSKFQGLLVRLKKDVTNQDDYNRFWPTAEPLPFSADFSRYKKKVHLSDQCIIQAAVTTTLCLLVV